MRSLVKLALAATCLAAVGCQRGSAPVSLTHASVLAKAGLESYWRMQLQLEEGQKVERLFLLDENLYCLTTGNYLIAVDAAKGVRKWTRRIADPGVKVYAPCHGNRVPMREQLPGVREIATLATPELLKSFDLVFVNTPDFALAFERDSGELMRKIDFHRRPDEFCANTAGACDGEYFYIGATNGRCYAFRVNEVVIAWILRTNDVMTAAPRCHKPGDTGRVFFAGQDAELYVAQAGNVLSTVWPPAGSRDWPAMAGPVVTEFHVDDRACFIPCVKRRVYAFSLAGGEPIWRFTCGGPLFDPIQVSENTVFQYARGDKLYAINPANGKLRWALPRGLRVLASMPANEIPMSYVLDDSGNLLVVDEILGKVRASIPLTACDLFADNTSAPAIYLAGTDGRLYCLRQLGAGRLTAEALKKTKTEKAKP
ncbi:MAG: PQQ-binding-like beta-propeller repeat protein [Phycisphaerae bacterium]